MARRIALVSSSYAPHPGGVETHVAQVARELRARGHHVVVWTVDRGERLVTRRDGDILVRYLPTPLPTRSAGGIARFLLRVPGAATAWWIALGRDRPEFLHVQCFGPNGVYALALSRLARRPLALTTHGETVADDHDAFGRSALLRWSLRRAIRDAALVSACSETALEDVRTRFGAGPAVVVGNGVQLQVPGFSAGDAPRNRPADAPAGAGRPPLVAVVGRVEHVKGFDLVIDALARPELPTDTRLAVGGDGGALAELRAQARRLGVSHRVDFLGRLDQLGVARLMERADVVVVPSRREAFGLVVLEAWRAGTPVVATPLGGPGELVTDGLDGLLVDPRRTGDLARAVAGLLADPARAGTLAAAGTSRLREFTWPVVVDRYERAYAAAGLGERPRRGRRLRRGERPVVPRS